MKQLYLSLMMCGITLALMMTACSSPSPTSPALIPTVAPQKPASQTDAPSHMPVILQVAERTGTKNGQTIIYKDITFRDADGDATLVMDKLVWSSQRPSMSNVDILASPDEQKVGATVTDAWGCGANPLIVVATRILDIAGNLSDPVTITIACPAAEPMNLVPFLIAGFIIGLCLLVGAWLLLRHRPSERRSVFQSLLLLFCLLFPLNLSYLILHEGGHALVNLVRGGTNETFYVHPFSFSGYNLPPFDWNSVLYHVGGALLVLPVSLFIIILFWKRRSVSNVLLQMIFPWTAIVQGMRILSVGGDFSNIVPLTGLPAIIFIGIGSVIVGVGIFFMVSLFPLLGLAPDNKESLFACPAALLLYSVLGMSVAFLFVPGSPIDTQYHLTGEIFVSTTGYLIGGTIIGALFAVIYVTLYRKVYQSLPTGMRTETARLTWNDLRLPSLLGVMSVILGLIVIT